MRTRVVAFVKDPLTEPVKTRLGQTIGRQRSSEFYVMCLRLLQVQFQELALSGLEPMIAVSSDQPSQTFAEIFSGTPFCQQGVGTIGERINAVDALVREQYRASRVVFIGSDSPTLPSHVILSAAQALDDFDAAIAPAKDGGFTALASKRRLPVFGTAVRWSHKETFHDTVSFLQKEKFTFSKLTAWHDVDDLEDMLLVRDYLSSQQSLTGLQSQLLAFICQCIAKGA